MNRIKKTSMDELDRANALAEQLSQVRKQLEDTRIKLAEMREQALVDTLTGIGNRRAMDDNLERMFSEMGRYGKSFSMLAIDFDSLKEVNDTWGHPAGDVVIKSTAQRLNELLRQSDMVYRVGGDEFIVLLSGTDREGAKITAARLCNAIAAHDIEVEDTVLHTSISVGLAEADGDDTARTLYDRADQMLYRAKDRGGNQFVSEDDVENRDKGEDESDE